MFDRIKRLFGLCVAEDSGDRKSEKEIEGLLHATAESLRAADGDMTEIENVIREYLRKGREMEFGGIEVIDFFVNPPLPVRAGYPRKKETEILELLVKILEEE